MIALSRVSGVAGYRLIEAMDWLDALLDASMVPGGASPVATLHSQVARGPRGAMPAHRLVMAITAGLLLAPFMHRLLHWLHLENRHAGED